MTELLDIESMRQLDTGALTTLKQRIERELMRRIELDRTEAAAREQLKLIATAVERTDDVGVVATAIADGLAQLAGFTGATSEDLQRAIEEDKQSEAPATNTPTPLTKRQLLREPDPGCTRCWGRGTQVSYSNATVALTKLCPCLWGGE